MLKILEARLQRYMNRELPNVQAGFRKGRETRDQIANNCWIIEKAREFRENIYFCFIDYAKAFRLGLPWFSGLWTQTEIHSSQFLVLQLADARSGVNSYSEWMDGWMAK